MNYQVRNLLNFMIFISVVALLVFAIGFSVSAYAEPAGALNANVTQDNIDSTICVAGWTKTIRPTASYTNKIKASQLPVGADLSLYEEDHFIPLSIGGAPRAKANLWAQAWKGTCNAKDKDRLELALQKSVCAGAISLKDAQTSILDWRKTYREYFGKDC